MAKFKGKKGRRGPRKRRGPIEPLEGAGNYVREWRIHRGMTLEELAEKVDMSTGAISAIENKTSGGQAKTRARLAKALDIDVGTMLTINPLQGAPIWVIWADADERQRDELSRMAITLSENWKRRSSR